MKILNALTVLIFVLLLLPFVATQSSTVQNQSIQAIVKCGVGKFFNSNQPPDPPDKNHADKGEEFTWHIIVDKPNTEVTFDFGATSPFGDLPADKKWTVTVPDKVQRYSRNVSNTADGSYHYTITCKEPVGVEVIEPIIEVPRKP